MRTSQLSNKIRQAGEAVHGQHHSYDDHNERAALRNFLKKSKPFQDFWANYFGTPTNTKIKDDPLGEYKVDLGIVDRTYESRIHGLIEVDVFESWDTSYPAHYKKFHVLERKLKYFMESSYNTEPDVNGDCGYSYITCTFNKWHTQMACTTRENIERCLTKYGIVKLWMPKIEAYDTVVRCPLDENIFWFGVNNDSRK